MAEVRIIAKTQGSRHVVDFTFLSKEVTGGDDPYFPQPSLSGDA